jgi:hypothetical protein
MPTQWWTEGDWPLSSQVWKSSTLFFCETETTTIVIDRCEVILPPRLERSELTHFRQYKSLLSNGCSSTNNCVFPDELVDPVDDAAPMLHLSEV